MQKSNRSLENIEAYSDRKAKSLLLRINLIGGTILLMVFSYLVVSHYQTKLEYLFSSVEESISQAVVRGDQHILDNMARSISRADDVAGVWITENAQDDTVGFYSKAFDRTLPATYQRPFVDGVLIKTLISKKLSANGFGNVGTLHILIQIPALKLLFLGTLLLGIFLFISLSFLSAFRKLSKTLSLPIVKLAEQISALGPNQIPQFDPSQNKFHEVESVAEAFQTLLRKKEESEKIAQASLRDAVKGRIASVVVHDVRQRLHNAFAVVESLKRKLGPQKELSMLHTALVSVDQTIVDIPKVDLSNLSKSTKKNLAEIGAVQNSTLYPYPVLALLEPVVKEYRTKAEIEDREIAIKIKFSDFAIKVAVDAAKFQRVISNLLSNSMKALGQNGTIEIEVKKEKDRVFVVVKDSGPGCTPEILSKIGTLGFTKFAENGTGTGLASSRAAAEAWTGSLKFTSELDKGFTATIELPAATGDSVYTDCIAIQGKDEVVIVDDDPEIHRKWNARLAELSSTVRVQSFYSAPEFRKWLKSAPAQKNYAFLFDLRLGSESDDGIALASEAPDTPSKWLITTNWSDADTRRRCEEMKMKLLSKDLLDSVPVVVRNQPGSHA